MIRDLGAAGENLCGDIRLIPPNHPTPYAPGRIELKELELR